MLQPQKQNEIAPWLVALTCSVAAFLICFGNYPQSQQSLKNIAGLVEKIESGRPQKVFIINQSGRSFYFLTIPEPLEKFKRIIGDLIEIEIGHNNKIYSLKYNELYLIKYIETRKNQLGTFYFWLTAGAAALLISIILKIRSHRSDTGNTGTVSK
jgi:hypothetical protein